MVYEFPTDLQERIRAQIDLGQFQSEDDVLHAAIGTLERQQQGIQELQAKVREAEDDVGAGRVAPFDAEETKWNLYT